jgi:hypothetical protein
MMTGPEVNRSLTRAFLQSGFVEGKSVESLLRKSDYTKVRGVIPNDRHCVLIDNIAEHIRIFFKRDHADLMTFLFCNFKTIITIYTSVLHVEHEHPLIHHFYQTIFDETNFTNHQFLGKISSLEHSGIYLKHDPQTGELTCVRP